MSRTVSTVRKHAIQVKSLAAEAKTDTLKDLVAKAIETTSVLERENLQEISSLLMKETEDLCDTQCREVLKKSAMLFAQLLKWEKELGALIKAAPKKIVA